MRPCWRSKELDGKQDRHHSQQERDGVSLTALLFTTHSRLVFTRADRGVFTTDDRPMFTTHDRLVFTTGAVRLHSSNLSWLEGQPVERLHMNYLRDLIYRLRAGESERRIAADLGLSRPTVHKYHLLAMSQGYLAADCALPSDAALQSTLGAAPQPPRQPSTVAAYGETVEQLLEQGCEMTAVFARLREDYGYTGSYSAVRRYVHQPRPSEPRVTMRMHSAPGDEVQVDFGSVGCLYDPRQGRPRQAYVFLATLCYSRHQYAELVFDQKIATWIGLHRRASPRSR